MRHAHPDKLNNQDDTRAKSLNNARDRAKQMFETYDFQKARLEKEYETGQRKRKLFRVIERIFNNHYERACVMSTDGPHFERFMQQCPPDIRKEAEDIVEFGMGDTRKKLEESEAFTIRLKQELEDIRSMQSKKKEAPPMDLVSQLQKENHSLNQKSEQMNQKIKELEQIIATHASQVSKKRIRSPHFQTREQLEEFCDKIDCFVHRKILPADAGSFITTKQIIAAFEKMDGRRVTSTFLFSRLISKHLREKYPAVSKTRAKNENIRGYQGLMLIQEGVSTDFINKSARRNKIQSGCNDK